MTKSFETTKAINRIASEKSLKNFLTKAIEYDIMIKLLRATKSNQKKLFQKKFEKTLDKSETV